MPRKTSPKKALRTTPPGDLVADQALPVDRHPALVYLLSLGPGSRRTMREAVFRTCTGVLECSATSQRISWAISTPLSSLSLLARRFLTWMARSGAVSFDRYGNGFARAFTGMGGATGRVSWSNW